MASAEHVDGPERAAREPGQDAVLDATAAGALQDEGQEPRKPVRHCDLIKENTQGTHTMITHKANVHGTACNGNV